MYFTSFECKAKIMNKFFITCCCQKTILPTTVTITGNAQGVMV